MALFNAAEEAADSYLDIIQILGPYLCIRTCLLLEVVERNQYGFQQVERLRASLQTDDYEMDGIIRYLKKLFALVIKL